MKFTQFEQTKIAPSAFDAANNGDLMTTAAHVVNAVLDNVLKDLQAVLADKHGPQYTMERLGIKSSMAVVDSFKVEL